MRLNPIIRLVAALAVSANLILLSVSPAGAEVSQSDGCRFLTALEPGDSLGTPNPVIRFYTEATEQDTPLDGDAVVEDKCVLTATLQEVSYSAEVAPWNARRNIIGTPRPVQSSTKLVGVGIEDADRPGRGGKFYAEVKVPVNANEDFCLRGWSGAAASPYERIPGSGAWACFDVPRKDDGGGSFPYLI